MEINLQTFLIVCPLVFLAGFIDSIAGGGGLISLPAYMISGIPTFNAIATNKLSSSLGTSVSAFRFARKKLVNWKLAIPGILVAIVGSNLGARLSLFIGEAIVRKMMIVVLPVVAFVVLKDNIFQDYPDHDNLTSSEMTKILIAVFFIGMYDGFYGPGTGTFLIIAFVLLGKLSMAQANGNCKIINLTSNLSALTFYVMSGKVLWGLGITAAISNMLGNYLGSGLVMKKGSPVVKPIILIVLTIFLGRLLLEMFQSF